MCPGMDINEFERIFNDNGWIEAMRYKDKSVPKILYKYCSLLDDRFVDYKNKNKYKLNSLKENKIWVSHYKEFNDPFEFKMLALDEDRLKKAGWNVEYIESFMDVFKDRTLISCFSSEVDGNMPMWAHYANNHKGYCVEYEVKNPRLIFPVSYEPIRTNSAVIPTMIIHEIAQSFKKGLTRPTEDFYKYFSYLFMSFCCKHNLWKYENEYRLLYPNIKLERGKFVSLPEAGLNVKAVYIGCKCEDEYTEEIKGIATDIGFEVYKMSFSEYSESYRLEPTGLNR